jgi:hypothetical protein
MKNEALGIVPVDADNTWLIEPVIPLPLNECSWGNSHGA